MAAAHEFTRLIALVVEKDTLWSGIYMPPEITRSLHCREDWNISNVCQGFILMGVSPVRWGSGLPPSPEVRGLAYNISLPFWVISESLISINRQEWNAGYPIYSYYPKFTILWLKINNFYYAGLEKNPNIHVVRDNTSMKLKRIKFDSHNCTLSPGKINLSN